MKIKDVPVSERPREKLLKYGKENLSDSELLAIILKVGTFNLSAIDVSLNILKEIGSISNLKKLSYEKLTKIKGVGPAKAIEILSMIELAKRIYYEKDSSLKEQYINSSIIYEKNKYLFDGSNQETFYCLYLNSKKELIERKLLFMGTLNRSVVHPREIFKEAYNLSASSIVCMHNHPSGDITPSREDIRLTEALMEIGNMNGIPIIDHVIFGKNAYYSFYEERGYRL